MPTRPHIGLALLLSALTTFAGDAFGAGNLQPSRDFAKQSSSALAAAQSRRIEQRTQRLSQTRSPQLLQRRQQLARAKSSSLPRLEHAPELIIFDWDGTLGDTYEQIRWIVTRSAQDIGLPELKTVNGVDPYRAIVDGAGLEVMYHKLTPHPTPEGEKKFVAAFQVNQTKAPLDLIKLKPETVAEIKALRQNHPHIKLAVASSRPQWVVKELVTKLDERLAEHGLAGAFSKIVGTGGSQTLKEKPAPDGLLHVAKELGVAPNRAVMVGDTTMDVEAGHAAGMQTVALRDGMGEPKALEAKQPTIILDSLDGFAKHVVPAKAPAKTRDVAAHP